MPRKPDKRKPTKQKSEKQSHKGNSQHGSLAARITIAVLTGLLSALLLQRLQFSFTYPGAQTILFGAVMAGLVFWLSGLRSAALLKMFRILVPVLFGMTLLANMALQFKWAESSPFLQFLASFFVIPGGLLGAYTLARSNIEDETVSVPDKRWFLKPSFLLPFGALLILGSILLFYRLGYYDFWEDENQMINAAVGLRDQGTAYLETGYERAWLDTWMISQSIKLFGVSEWSARFPSACFGVLFMIVSAFVLYKWFRNPYVALLTPAVCLLTDEFLILFRYARMYAPLIPVFLMTMYALYRFLVSPMEEDQNTQKWRLFGFHLGWGIAVIILSYLSLHLHLLSAAGFIVAALFTALLAAVTRKKVYVLTTLGMILFGVLILLLWQAGVPGFKFVKVAMKRLTQHDQPEYAYFQFLFNNGLPANAVLMTLISGAGLFFCKTFQRPSKWRMAYLCLIILVPLIFMVYLMADQGRDYRYIVHIVPFVVGGTVFILYTWGRLAKSGSVRYLVLLLPLLYTLITFSKEYSEVYVRHPWSPLYSVVYSDLKNQYKPGEAIFYQNMKTYYLNPRDLAGEKAIKLGKRKELSLEDFKKMFNQEAAGWILFDSHKSYHLDRDILTFIAKKCEKRHGYGVDDMGVEVYYFFHQPEMTNDQGQDQ